MTAPVPPLAVARCVSCRATFVPPRGSCPRCGRRGLVAEEIAPDGVVVAATELATPPAGWTSPHTLVLVELSEGVRVLAGFSGSVPQMGQAVRVAVRGAGYTLA